jgi:single-strand DNA-binding protein
MGSVNKVIIVGNLGSDPEVRYTAGGQAVANFNVATNEVWNDKDGQKKERTEWHRIVVWGRQAETAAQYLKKGRQAYIEGRLQSREYDDREGNKKQVTEVVAQKIVFLGGGRAGEELNMEGGGSGGGSGGGGGGGRGGNWGGGGGGGARRGGGGAPGGGGGGRGQDAPPPSDDSHGPAPSDDDDIPF